MNLSIRRFIAEEDGITALEYGLLAAIVAGVIVASFKGPLGDFLDKVFAKLETSIT